jgi:PIN domain nuclease of toxin-antitoxin system
MTLLDTHALLWLDQNHRRARPLARAAAPLAVSPATLLELHFLVEAGRIRLRSGTVRALLDDERWAIDEPPSLDWFSRASEESWTRDPFDRLIVAHARLRRWRLATGDLAVLGQLRPSERLEL